MMTEKYKRDFMMTIYGLLLAHDKDIAAQFLEVIEEITSGEEKE